jgi:hypothetical protein
MDELYEQLLRDMEQALDRLTKRVPAPQWIRLIGERFAFRYVERTAQQAIIQKLARIITGLRAAHLLLRHGLVQEEAVIHRVLGDLIEDVLFLSYGILKNDLKEKLHESYLADFYQEEFDDPNNPLTIRKRSPAPRRKIQAYLARADLGIGNPSDNQEAFRIIQQVFSGFVHAASGQILDMYGGSPPHFHVRGMLDTPRMPEYERDIWNYFERGMADFFIAAGVLGDGELQQSLLAQKKTFDAESERLRT